MYGWMFVYVCMYVGKDAQVYICLYESDIIHRETCMVMYLCVHAYMYVCMYAFRQTCMSIYMYICMYLDMHT